jgi:hypothetical protein
MDESVEWRDLKYDEVFEQELRGLARRRETESACTVEAIEGVLRHLYIMDGADWYGRGCVQDITTAATIAAYEQYIAQWRASEQQGEKHGMASESHFGEGSVPGG